MTPPLVGALLCALIATAVAPTRSPVPLVAQLQPAEDVAVPLPELPLRQELAAALDELEPNPMGDSQAELMQLRREDVPRLGSIAIGLPHRGRLVNAVQMPEGDGYDLVDAAHSWGTLESVLTLTLVLQRLHRDDPQAPVLQVGQLSRQSGGWLKRHKSHQTGRDVDLGLFYRDGSHWYARANAGNLDVVRTYKLVSMLLETEQVEYIFLDRSLIALLRDHAQAQGLGLDALRRMFYDKADAPEGALRHAWGHSTHLHVRFKSPRAEARGQRLAPRLAALGLR
jgi:penicillin-insensitive murein endopeptidase